MEFRWEKDIIQTIKYHFQPFSENYLRNRRNAVAKVKPVRTLRKRPHSQLPSVLGSKLGEKRTETRQTGQQNKKETSKTDIKATILETQLGKRKARVNNEIKIITI
jgi:hypothetical protein